MLSTFKLTSKICDNKKRYKSKTSVFKTGRIEMRIRENQKQLYAYICPICYCWHLTHFAKTVDIEKFKII